MEGAPEVLKTLAEGFADDPAITDLRERFMFFKKHMRSHSMQVNEVMIVSFKEQGP